MRDTQATMRQESMRRTASDLRRGSRQLHSQFLLLRSVDHIVRFYHSLHCILIVRVAVDVQFLIRISTSTDFAWIAIDISMLIDGCPVYVQGRPKKVHHYQMIKKLY